ncbi:hypothetical protein, partial [Desertihabitans aurantiacus]|uniref:hypothetical protein n=1 Tax=Desertihabitans aurantiacus TaxID=2282477 RepID=UPI0018E58A86
WRALRRYLAGRRTRSRLRERVGAAPATDQGRATAHLLRPRWWYSLRLGVEWVAGAVSDAWRDLGGRRQDTSLDELTGDDFAGREDAGAPWWHAPLALLVGVVLVAGVFGRTLSPGLLTATQLLPGATTLTTSWGRYLDPVTAADGVVAPPWVGLAALLATPLGGHTDWVLVVVLAGAVGLAFLTARAALRALDVDPVTAVWVSALWALLPTVLGAAQRGSLLAVGVAVVLPLLLRAATRLVGRPGLESVRGAFGVALAATVLLALQPALLVLLVPAGLLGLLLRPRLRAQVAVAVGVPVLLLGPWWPTLVRHPGRWLTGPSPTLVPDEPAAVWRLLLGQTPGPAWFDGGPVPLALTAPVVLGCLALGVLGLVRRGRQPVVRNAWLVAVLGLAAAVLASRMVVAVP